MARSSTAQNTGRDAKGHWLPGYAPNPRGRRPLAEEERHLKPYRDAWPEIAAQRIQHAKQGCCRCMDAVEYRLMGKPSQPITIEDAREVARLLGLNDDDAPAIFETARGLRLVK